MSVLMAGERIGSGGDMARFTFGSGNARKLLRLPLYALGALATLVVPRTASLWVFGCGIGLGEGALPLHDLAVSTIGRPGGAARAERDGVRIVWLASTPAELAEARARGMDAELKTGRRGFWLTLRAKVAVVTHGFGDVNRYAIRGAVIAQLWHGIPLKRLHLDSPEALRVASVPDHPIVRRSMARAYRTAGRQIGVFPVASSLVGARIASAFGLPADRILVSGDPRDDVLLRGTATERRDGARVRLEAATGAPLADGPVVLYAPTWRDGDPDPGAPTAADWRAIGGWLADVDGTMLVRTHPLGAGDYAEGPATSERIRMLGGDVLREVTPVLPAIDDLVTDYSSIAFDHALTGGRQLFLAPDLERYAKRRGLYGTYREATGGRHVADWAEVLLWLDDDRAASAAHTRWLVSEHFDRLDGRATERVLARLLELSGSARSAPEEPAPLSGSADVALAEAVAAPMTPRPVVERVEFVGGREPTLALRLRGLPRGAGLRLQGVRARVHGVESVPGAPDLPDEPGSLARAEARRFTFPLLGARWGSTELALPSGTYRLEVLVDGDEPSSRVDVTTVASTQHPLFRAELHAAAGGLDLVVGPPLDDDERGPERQRELEAAYHRAIFVPEDAVFLESFYGRSASDNPLGIDRALQRLRPETTRYWSVVDASIPVPDGAVRVIEGSRAWWHARGASRVLIVNDWLRKRFRRRSHQKVLQTWHGTMLKRLAIDRPKIGLRTRLAVLRERDRWDLLLAQNSYAADILRSAYAFNGPIWLEGYPRNDVLVDGDPDAVRRRLGVPHGMRIVLYAPTWRDDREELVDYLDLETFAEDLGPETVLLVRGHSRTLPFGRDLEGIGLLDVTGYPSMADLLLVADVLVTDYSSVMFDWASTGRPIVFFTPDLAHYSADLRGFYFDLIAEAPGPVVETREALLDTLDDIENRTDVFTGPRAVWRERFAPHDDGAAGERVVRRLLDEGLL